MKKVIVHLADGFEEIEALAVVDILRRAGIDTKMVSIMGKKLVTGGHNIVVQADALFEDTDYSDIDMIILPGGNVGTRNLKAHSRLAEKIKMFNENKKWIAAICAAPTVLGGLGLLAGKTAVCYPGCEDDLNGANVGCEPVSVDGNIITSKAPGTTLHFGLKLVEVLVGSEMVQTLKEGMLIS